MAFGFKARKVNMMRGNRQGNNAFLEDLNNEYKRPSEYLVKHIGCWWDAFGKGTVERDTLITIQRCLGADSFREFAEKSLAEVLFKTGSLKTLESLYRIIGVEGDLVESIFNKVFFELLFHDGSETSPFTFDDHLLTVALRLFHCPALGIRHDICPLLLRNLVVVLSQPRVRRPFCQTRSYSLNVRSSSAVCGRKRTTTA